MFNTSQLQEWQKQQRSPTTSRQSSSTTSTSSLFPQATNTQPQHNKNKTQSVLFPTNTPHNVGKSTSQQPSLYSNMPPVTSSTSASLFPSNPPVHTSNNTQNTRPNNNGGIPTPTGASLFGPASTSNSSMNANVSSSTKTNQAPPPLFGSYTPSHATANTRVSNSGINNNINPHTHTNTGTHSLFGVAPSTRTAAGGQHLRTDSTDSRASSYGTRLSQSQAYVHTQPLHTQRQASVTGNSHSSFQRDTQPSSTTPSGSTRNSLVGGADGIMSLNTGTVNQDVDTDSNIDTRTSISSEGLAKFPTIPTGPLERNDSTDSLDGLFRTPVPADIKPSTTATLPTRSDTVVAPTQQQQQQQQHRTQQVYQPALQHTQVEPQAFPPTHPPTQPPVEYSTQPQTSSDNLQQTMPGYLPTTLINSESVFPAAPPVWKSSGLPVSTFTPSQPQSNSGQSTAEGQHTDETPSRMQSSTADGLEDAQAFNRTGSSASTAVQRSGSIPTPRLGAPPMFNPTPVFGAPPVFSAPPQPAHDVAASFQVRTVYAVV
ncbi:hypothetical protein SARC_07721 [Sphaeroforma arctica JP610]|uniref:Uncharacterized protein n=1 Tax=Sphaeroforma arctica JP610 TaxID=667725 RepID=A0A0L0FSW4_9EUKA|nr:hypothetical protein SARC_07721 [Sphaeroforma arctica JP610]KNC79902.1 hypothetical protein SARC_07721 [Sphaeroforma arctica JP610]|eukprot:XP_014153804.1 hypothetical protein SARC_07721 [Sphaeroforma arctica JP610]